MKKVLALYSEKWFTNIADAKNQPNTKLTQNKKKFKKIKKSVDLIYRV